MFSDPSRDEGHVFWLFGLSGAGKSTLANLLADEMRRQNVPVLSLDGDVLRATLSQGLSFSEADRAENLRRAACVARIGLESALTVVAAFITPLEQHRQMIASLLPPENLSFIYVNASLEVCRARDVKGLYARAQSGLVPQMTGISAAFEEPRQVDLELPTSHETVGQSREKLLGFVYRNGARRVFRPQVQRARGQMP